MRKRCRRASRTCCSADQANLANAKAMSARQQDLLQRGIATREQAETARTAAEALDATVAADRANVDNAKVQLDYATITSPLDGRTGLLQVHPGNLVRANDTTPIITINKITPVYVSFALPEAQLPALKRYMARGELPVTAQAPNDAGPPSVGKITFIDNAVAVTINKITPVYVSFALPEAQLPALKRYMARGELPVTAQ